MPQVIGPGMGDAYLRMKLKDQEMAIHMITTDPALQGLSMVGWVELGATPCTWSCVWGVNLNDPALQGLSMVRKRRAGELRLLLL